MSEVSQHNEPFTEAIEKALERYHEIKSVPTDLTGMNNQRMIELSFDLKQITRNFPEWIRALLDQLALTESEYQSVVTRYGEMARGYEKVKAECERRHGYWHNGLITIESLRTELSAKDKVLEQIATKTHGSAEMARTILSQYRGDTHE